ncbi:Protein kinase domain-containing protein [Mycena kentingensis (nom. inval.)]|nr:Protein kinase domain-containing protein [Mycena kentingensis (nom. inval.)]
MLSRDKLSLSASLLPNPAYPDQLPNLVGELVGDRQYEIVKLLLHGTGFDLYQARFLSSSQLRPTYVLVKCTILPPLDSAEFTVLEDQTRIYLVLDFHPRLSTLRYQSCSAKLHFQVFDYSPTKLSTLINQGYFIGKPERAREVVDEIVDIVEFLHSEGVYHRNLTPDAFICDEDGSSIRLLDLSSATRNPFNAVLPSTHASAPAYSAPEHYYPVGEDRLSRLSDGAMMDTWAVAVILFQLFVHKQPWGSTSTPAYATFASRPPNSDDHFVDAFGVTPEASAFFTKCFGADAWERYTVGSMCGWVYRLRFFPDDPEPPVALTQHDIARPSSPAYPKRFPTRVASPVPTELGIKVLPATPTRPRQPSEETASSTESGHASSELFTANSAASSSTSVASSTKNAAITPLKTTKGLFMPSFVSEPSPISPLSPTKASLILPPPVQYLAVQDTRIRKKRSAASLAIARMMHSRSPPPAEGEDEPVVVTKTSIEAAAQDPRSPAPPVSFKQTRVHKARESVASIVRMMGSVAS